MVQKQKQIMENSFSKVRLPSTVPLCRVPCQTEEPILWNEPGHFQTIVIAEGSKASLEHVTSMNSMGSPPALRFLKIGPSSAREHRGHSTKQLRSGTLRTVSTRAPLFKQITLNRLQTQILGHRKSLCRTFKAHNLIIVHRLLAS